MRKTVLTAAQSTGDPFHVADLPLSGPGVFFIQLYDHAGGTWVTEMRNPDGTWTDIDVDFDGDGVQQVRAAHKAVYRLNGGNAGAGARAFD